ncbi:hypothetical protein [Halocynthiibacter styelae]|uniref:Uncharacterized protein n=1 Tax=Halocynthiibacter styelae TaxID=2761955 RepID=A0A8J7LKW1_9RHOB|nr:hypothetical protein [Paenihalocynthiibacter styelae]MBI1493434.1 hypothetical protein [Paenihalocynthiibacter styelae]
MTSPDPIAGAFPSHILTCSETGQWWMCQSEEFANNMARDAGLTKFKITELAQ